MPVNKPFVSNRPIQSQPTFFNRRKHILENKYHEMVILITNVVALIPFTPNAMITNQ